MDIDKLIEAVRLCGSSPTIYQCEACAYYTGGDMGACIPEMTAQAADALSALRTVPTLSGRTTGFRGGISMERLTYWCDDGQGGGEWRVNIYGREERGLHVDRLAAYEDTGLEPEEIKATFTPEAVIKLAAQALGTTPDRLRELAQADREGRVVVQRFSPGQTVWIVERDEDDEAYDFSGYVFVTSLRGIVLVSPRINWSSEIDVILMEQIKSRINCSGGSIEAYPADDCYLTREAAEQALGSDNNG